MTAAASRPVPNQPSREPITMEWLQDSGTRLSKATPASLNTHPRSGRGSRRGNRSITRSSGRWRARSSSRYGNLETESFLRSWGFAPRRGQSVTIGGTPRFAMRTVTTHETLSRICPGAACRQGLARAPGVPCPMTAGLAAPSLHRSRIGCLWPSSTGACVFGRDGGTLPRRGGGVPASGPPDLPRSVRPRGHPECRTKSATQSIASPPIPGAKPTTSPQR